MGGTESNCCGSRPGLQINTSEDPDSGIIGRKRRFQNLDPTQLLSQQQSNSFSQDSFYDTINHQTHSFQITGNITVSSNINNNDNGLSLNSPLPCGITVNINGLSPNNNNKNTENTYVYTTNNNNNKNKLNTVKLSPIKHKITEPSIEIKQPISNGLINVKNNENTINYNNNYTNNNWVENYNRENNDESDDIDTLKNTSETDDEDDDMESIISYLSNAPNSENEAKQWYENENKYHDKYDLDCMETLQLKNINNDDDNDSKTRKGSNNHLFNAQDVQNWNTNDMEQLEMEMLREMRRLSAKSLNQHSNIQYVNVKNNLSNIN